MRAPKPTKVRAFPPAVPHHFRTSYDTFEALSILTVQQCQDLLANLPTLELVTDANLCRLMADRLEQWRQQNPNGAVLEASNLEVRELLKHAPYPRWAENVRPPPWSHSAFDNTDMKDWVEFLRHCGGYKVEP